MNTSLKRKVSEAALGELHWMKPMLDASDGLRLEAREADVQLGRRSTAQTLERPDSPATATHASVGSGSQLLRLDTAGDDGGGTWVDRFDARLLLSSLPSYSSKSSEPLDNTASPSCGWSDLPSDSEDAFFLAPEEMDDIRTAKRRRALDDARTERLSAMQAIENAAPSEDADDGEELGDEELDEEQLSLMRRTAAHLHASPDRTRLIARILANHGSDRRFAFLRGQWQRAWANVQQEVLDEETKKANSVDSTDLVGLGLGGYGDSDDDDASTGGPEGPGEDRSDPPPVVTTASVDDEEEAKKKARRQRAREWSMQRRQRAKTELIEDSE